MKHDPVSTTRRRAVNISLDDATVVAAKDLGLNISRIAQVAVAAEVKRERDRRWQDEHREAIEANNAWVEKNGLPLADLRLF